MKIKKDLFDKLQKLNTGMLDANGKELFNPMPMEASVDLVKPESLEDRIAQLIKGSLSQQAAEQEYETLEESDDFDLEDDYVVELSGYELADDEIPIMNPEIPPEDDPNPQPVVADPEPDPEPAEPDPNKKSDEN